VRPTFIIGALEREKTLPTGLPLGGTINAAIPHTDIHHVIHAAVALATLNKPVIFQNMVNSEEEVPVRIVFLLALKEAHAQIEMLQEIAGILQNESVINDLMKANSNKEVLAILEKA
jgi:PTS system galactitol-specific IIA component